MIALVRCSAPSAAGNGTGELTSLPEAPASRYTAFAVRCRNEVEVREALVWYRTLLESRPGAPLGLIARANDCVQPVANLDRSLVFVMDPARLNGGGLPASVLKTLREAGIEGRILEEIVGEYGPQVLSERESLEALIARAVSGSTIGRAASDLGIHPETLARQLKGVGLSARRARQWARLRGYEHRVRLGTDPRIALVASGWTDQEQRRKAAARLRGGSRAEAVKIRFTEWMECRISGGGYVGFRVFRRAFIGYNNGMARLTEFTGRPGCPGTAERTPSPCDFVTH